MSRRAFLGPVERLVLIRDGFYSPDPACRRRAAVLLALDRGSTLVAAARSAKCNRSSIYRWLSNYLEHRDPAALGDNRRRFAGSPRRRHAALVERAERLRALAAETGAAEPAAAGSGSGSGSGSGRLGLEPSARAGLDALAADPSAPPRDRYYAALLVALDRGARPTTVARAGTCDRATVLHAPARHLHRLLARLGREAAG